MEKMLTSWNFHPASVKYDLQQGSLTVAGREIVRVKVENFSMVFQWCDGEWQKWNDLHESNEFVEVKNEAQGRLQKAKDRVNSKGKAKALNRAQGGAWQMLFHLTALQWAVLIVVFPVMVVVVVVVVVPSWAKSWSLTGMWKAWVIWKRKKLSTICLGTMSMCVAFRKLGKASLTFHCVVLFSFFLEAILDPWSGTGLVSLSLPASSKEFKVFARFLKGLLLWKSIALVVLLCSSLLWRLTIYDLKVKSGSSTTNLGRFCQPLLQMDRSYWLVILVLVWAKPALERKMSLAHIVSELKHNTRLMCRTVTSWWNFAAAICWVLWIRILITHLTRWPPATSPVFPHARPFAVVRFLSWICSLSLSAF